MKHSINLCDLAAYAWFLVFVVIFGLAFPPTFLALLLIPRWHSRRVRRRARHAEERAFARKLAALERIR